jgi:hypothetical protein
MEGRPGGRGGSPRGRIRERTGTIHLVLSLGLLCVLSAASQGSSGAVPVTRMRSSLLAAGHTGSWEEGFGSPVLPELDGDVLCWCMDGTDLIAHMASSDGTAAAGTTRPSPIRVSS